MNERINPPGDSSEASAEKGAEYRRLSRALEQKLQSLTFGRVSPGDFEALEQELAAFPNKNEIMASFAPLTDDECERILADLLPLPAATHGDVQGTRRGLALSIGVMPIGLAAAVHRLFGFIERGKLVWLTIAAIRLPVVLATTSVAAFALFRCMHLLIMAPEISFGEAIQTTVVRTASPPTQRVHQAREDHALPRRSKPKTLPPTPKAARLSPSSIKQTTIKPQRPSVDMKLDLRGVVRAPRDPLLNRHGRGPLIRVEPQYPTTALKNRIDGWVVVQFDITSRGKTTNVSILDSHPKATFDAVALDAVRKWKYRPQAGGSGARTSRRRTIRFNFSPDSLD